MGIELMRLYTKIWLIIHIFYSDNVLEIVICSFAEFLLKVWQSWSPLYHKSALSRKIIPTSYHNVPFMSPILAIVNDINA